MSVSDGQISTGWDGDSGVSSRYYEAVVDVSPFLWFDDDAEQALEFYARVIERHTDDRRNGRFAA